MDRLANIEAFVEVAANGSFTVAAKRLRVSASALSRRVAQLEENLGVRLLHRSTRAVRLSEEGSAFFERARTALRELSSAEEATGQMRARPTGLLRVAAPTIVGRHLLVPSVPKFLARFPDVRVELTLQDQPADAVAEGIDVALRFGPLRDSGLTVKKLGRSQMRLCAAPDYVRKRGAPRSFSALERHDRLGFALHGRSMAWRLRERGKERDVVPSGRISVDSAEALIDLAIAGAGLAWVCDFMMMRGKKAGALVEVWPESSCVSTPIAVVTLPARNVLPKVRAFIDFISAELRQSGALAS